MPDTALIDTSATLACDGIHVGYLVAPQLDRLMGLRNALVAMKGPLASEPELQNNLRKRLFSEEADSHMLGKLNTSSSL